MLHHVLARNVFVVNTYKMICIHMLTSKTLLAPHVKCVHFYLHFCSSPPVSGECGAPVVHLQVWRPPSQDELGTCG